MFRVKVDSGRTFSPRSPGRCARTTSASSRRPGQARALSYDLTKAASPSATTNRPMKVRPSVKPMCERCRDQAARPYDRHPARTPGTSKGRVETTDGQDRRRQPPQSGSRSGWTTSTGSAARPRRRSCACSSSIPTRRCVTSPTRRSRSSATTSTPSSRSRATFAERAQAIKRLAEIGSYRGIRHRRGLGPRKATKTNGRTRKGLAKPVGRGKKAK